MIDIFLPFLVSFAIGLLIAPLVLKGAKKLHANQTILQYVTTHQQKQGTPTLGGLIFIIASTLTFIIFNNGQAYLAWVALAVFLCFGLLGFLDDFIKIKTHKNLGLRAYQKVIGQLGISGIIAYFVYTSGLIGTTIYLPWSFVAIDIGWWIIPFVIFVYLAMTNSANLTDGLDGLAGGVSFVAMGFVVALVLILNETLFLGGASLILYQEYSNLAVLGVCVMGGLLAFLCFNSHPASIFMGDTGSLGLGAIITSIALFSGQALALPIICIMFVLSAVSVAMQVLYYKWKKKRIFLMAPLHHHFEQKGVNETKIVAIYIIITIIAGVTSLVLCLLGR